MEVLVIGAAGKSGRAVVEQALAAGHDVTAFVHKTEAYLPDSNVRVIEGDAREDGHRRHSENGHRELVERPVNS
jgi:nucleoside-diphosphate-sugar epimerase